MASIKSAAKIESGASVSAMEDCVDTETKKINSWLLKAMSNSADVFDTLEEAGAPEELIESIKSSI